MFEIARPEGAKTPHHLLILNSGGTNESRAFRSFIFRSKDLVCGGPDLVGDYCHHEQEVESESPEDDQFGAIEVAAGDVVLLDADELVVFERGQDQGLVGGGDMGWGGLCFSHKPEVPQESNFIDEDKKVRSCARLDSRARLSPRGCLCKTEEVSLLLPRERVSFH